MHHDWLATSNIDRLYHPCMPTKVNCACSYGRTCNDSRRPCFRDNRTVIRAGRMTNDVESVKYFWGGRRALCSELAIESMEISFSDVYIED